MKKYLMMVLAAAAIVSCSKNDDVSVNPSDLTKSKYDAAFLKYVGGSIDRNQDWGFSTTRAAVNVNGNMWETTPECTAAEAAAVFAYVNKVKSQVEHYTEQFPENLSAYYVTQVYTGTDTYSTFDGTSTGILGSSHMDNLHIAENTEASIEDGALTGDWYHVNNFNASSNMNWGGNTLVTETGSCDFAYNCSEDSRYHNKWIAIDGKYITDADGVNHAGKYYVCFDFIAENPEAYTNFQAPGIGNIEVPGAWKSTEEAVAAGAKGKKWNWNSETQTSELEWVPVASDWTIGNVNGGNKVIPANEVYTDWIIRLVAAKPKTADLRIICEDLSASGDSDFDFNDVVVDVLYGDPAVLTLVAAGGTLPLKVAGSEVHALFGYPDAKADGKYEMINTGAGPNVESKNIPFTQSISNAAEANSKIVIEVFKDNKWQTLTAEKGEPACKLAVDTSFRILRERQSIKGEYPLFIDWVKDANFTSKWW